MSKVFKLNYSGIGKMLKSDEFREVCLTAADRLASAAGPGYEAEERRTSQRVGAAVYPGDEDAWRDNLVNNTLEKLYRSFKL